MKYRPINRYFKEFLEEFWIIPSDALVRATEASIWHKQLLKNPVLDIGFGKGTNSSIMLRKHKGIDMGIDFDPKNIEEAKNCNIYKNIRVADATKLPFKDETYRSVIINSTIEHIKNDLKVISEVKRVLKNKGKLYMTVPTPYFLEILNNIGVNNKDLMKYNKRVEHYHYRNLNQWKNILNNNNLKITKYSYYFPEEVVRYWYLLYKIAIFKPYKRELWSYLQDKRINKFIPNKTISKIQYILLKPLFKKVFNPNGGWLFITAVKIK